MHANQAHLFAHTTIGSLCPDSTITGAFMNHLLRTLSLAAMSIFAAIVLHSNCTAADFGLVAGNIYTSDSSSNTIKQVTPNGTDVATLILSGYPMGTKGLAFGPDHTLYVVATAAHGYDVIHLGMSGEVLGTYAGPTYVQGNLSFGKLAVSSTGRVYVAGQDNLLSLQPGVTGTSPIYTDNGVFDLDILPNGNLLVLTSYRVVELSPEGALLRVVIPSHSVVDGRGIKYDPATNSFYTTMIGYSGHFHEMRRWDFESGAMEDWANYTYADDIDQFLDGRLIFGSRTQPPGIFDRDLGMLTTLNGTQRMFLAINNIDPVFRDDFEQ